MSEKWTEQDRRAFDEWFSGTNPSGVDDLRGFAYQAWKDAILRERDQNAGEAVSVPDAKVQKCFRESDPERFGYVRGWNACRDAMLASAPTAHAGEEEDHA